MYLPNGSRGKRYAVELSEGILPRWTERRAHYFLYIRVRDIRCDVNECTYLHLPIWHVMRTVLHASEDVFYLRWQYMTVFHEPLPVRSRKMMLRKKC